MSEDINYKGEKLTPEQMSVLRKQGTEAPFSGKYVHKGDKGTYVCQSCGQPLFHSDAQFDSSSGWPSFVKPIEGSVEYKDDSTLGMQRTEVVCKNCGAHLGHVFEDGPDQMPDGSDADGKRFCINSVCLDLQKDEAS